MVIMNSRRFTLKNSEERGFTIIELMIATTVFSLILLLSMAGIMQITRLYYRGVTQASTQEAARSIADEFSQSIQFSNSDVYYPTGDDANPTGPSVDVGGEPIGFICIGGKRYTFQIDRQLKIDNPDSTIKQTSTGLWVDNPKAADGTPLGCAGSVVVAPLDLTDSNAVDDSEGLELLDENMRLTKLSIEPAVATSDSIWKIDIAVAYGDEDLLEVLDNGTPGDTSDDRKVCRPSGPGIEFCAVSEISTTVRRRVE